MSGIARPRNPNLSDRANSQSRWAALVPTTEDPPSQRERVDALLYSLSFTPHPDDAAEPTADLVLAASTASDYAYLVSTAADARSSYVQQPLIQKSWAFFSKPGIPRPPDPDVAADLPHSQTLWSALPPETSHPPSELEQGLATEYYTSFATVAADGFRTREIEAALLSADEYVRRITAAMYPELFQSKQPAPEMPWARWTRR